ncbi:MAG: tRNA pseudouridine(55) synthase TruB [Devosia sp.]
MNEKRPKRAISGWLVLDKPLGMTSTQAVAKVRWLYNAEKAGHAGTLDPLATGILPIALGEATKTVPFVQDGQKRYAFDIAWGAETSTDDAEGDIVETSDVRPGELAVRAALPAFTGTILQRPPAFSAIKIGGERAYDLARAGEAVELAERPVTIAELTLVQHGAERSRFEMACEKGTYVRALARDLARALGTRGHVVQLRRTAVGGFGKKDAVLLPAIEAASDRDGILLPLSIALIRLPEFRLGADDAATIRNGGAVLLRGAGAPVAVDAAWVSFAGGAIAIGHVERGQFHPTRVLRV